MAEKVSQWLELCMAYITGDDDKAKSLKIQRKAELTLKAQVAVKEAKLLNLEEVVENAKEGLIKARVNGGELIGEDSSSYIRNLLEAKVRLEKAEDAVSDLKSDIKFLKSELDSINK